MKKLDNVQLSPACAALPVDVFHRRDGEPSGQWALRQRVALAACQACPVREACLEDALRHPSIEQHGVAGGETAAARKRILRERRAARSDVTADIPTSVTEVAA